MQLEIKIHLNGNRLAFRDIKKDSRPLEVYWDILLDASFGAIVPSSQCTNDCALKAFHACSRRETKGKKQRSFDRCHPYHQMANHWGESLKSIL
ncbi:hypothetical protein PUN28_008145 [Cardiocondyla obscurior]|uniref:Uncharacterized protein n=1 Tax=Cardiocondyla obscurior TaxID=286306 RepID=A0AAW2FXX7_9HYME